MGYIPTSRGIDGEFMQANFEEAEQSLEIFKQDTQRNCTLSGFKPRMMAAIHAMEAQLGEGSQFRRFMSKVSQRVRNMETNTLMVAVAVLDLATHYRHKFSSNPEYAQALTHAIEKMAINNLERNPIWDWLDKSMSDVGPSLDDIYASRLDKSACGRNGKNKNRKRVRVEDEEEDIEFLDSEDGHEEDEFEDALSDSDDDHDELSCDDDGIGDNGVETSPRVEGNIETSSEGDLNPNDRRFGRLHQKRMRLQTLYQRE
ncbi:uncharacterized protein C2845_PM01G30340 [Panicum miliaceum]|uniref:Uncharacterized protein n=1 Tax=Panicum miliaceum TaxID=4540 RepID=A0A3L6TNV5_PANMI|nr:uncharacterized protein C2845_PM01G30340 [Panicum miliaceum]